MKGKGSCGEIKTKGSKGSKGGRGGRKSYGN